MNSNKIELDNNIIEIQNNWIGVQTILFNGKTISKIFSFSGAKHYFTIMNNGDEKSYILTTKTSLKKQLLKSNQLAVDLKCNGKLIKENLIIETGSNQKKETNKNKSAGIKFLREYEVESAIKTFKLGLEIDRNDPEIYFYLACCYSLLERPKEGFECIMKAVENNLNDKEMILKHEMLAHLRIQDEFKDFIDSNFTKYY